MADELALVGTRPVPSPYWCHFTVDLKSTLSISQPPIGDPDTRAVVWLDIDNTLYPKRQSRLRSTAHARAHPPSRPSLIRDPDPRAHAEEDPRSVSLPGSYLIRCTCCGRLTHLAHQRSLTSDRVGRTSLLSFARPPGREGGRATQEVLP